MQIKRIQRKIIVANALHVRLNGLYNEIADMYGKYLSDEIKEIGFFISNVPGDGICMHLNYDSGYIAPLSFINEYLSDDDNTIITLDVFFKLTI